MNDVTVYQTPACQFPVKALIHGLLASNER